MDWLHNRDLYENLALIGAALGVCYALLMPLVRKKRAEEKARITAGHAK